MDSQEGAHLARQIEKLRVEQNHGSILDLLRVLDEARVPAELLETTDMVQVVYRLVKSCSEKSVKKAARGLLSKWKREYSKSTQRAATAEETGERESPRGSTECLPASSVRSKCAELLLAALHPETGDQEKAAQLARDIEKSVHALHGTNQGKYKGCVRSKVANLRNPRNGHLRRDLLNGSLTPEAFANMSQEEMACAELRKLRSEYTCRGVRERQLPETPQGSHTQKIRCRRCGGSECRVTQMSRGALFLPAWVRRGDPGEDAMTFVSCSGCGQQWYHSGWDCL